MWDEEEDSASKAQETQLPGNRRKLLLPLSLFAVASKDLIFLFLFGRGEDPKDTGGRGINPFWRDSRGEMSSVRCEDHS